MSPTAQLLVTTAPEPGGLRNNVWLVGDDHEVIVIDPAHNASEVLAAVAGRRVRAALLTHGHWDHSRAAAEFARLANCRVWLHPADEFLWRAEHHDAEYAALTDGASFAVAGITLTVRHTPGHTPGSTSVVAEQLGAVFTGDTLFEGGPGATRWAYSSFTQLMESIETRLLTLPDATVVHTGHGPDTTIAAERARMPEYLARGW